MKRLTSTTATARRCDEWWAIEVPEIPDLFAQARRLDQVEAMVKDVAQLLDIQIEHISVEPEPLPAPPSANTGVDDSKHALAASNAIVFTPHFLTRGLR